MNGINYLQKKRNHSTKRLKKQDYIGNKTINLIANNIRIYLIKQLRDEKLKKARVDAEEAIKSYQREQEERMEAEKEKV